MTEYRLYLDPSVAGQAFDAQTAAMVTDPDSDTAASLSATYARLRPLDPREYGALGDGTTDDTTALIACITAAGTGGVMELPPLTFRVTSTLDLPSGFELRGTGMKGSTIQAVGDITAIRTIGGEGQSLRNFRISNGFTGTRTTYDIEMVNPFHPAIEDVEIALSQSALACGGILLRKDVGQPGSSDCYMPVLSNVLVRNGVVKIVDVTDVKMAHSWVWATYTAAPGAIELSGASNCSFVDVDIVPSVNAGYLVSGALSNLTILGGLMDGNGNPAIHPGPGFKITSGQYARKVSIMGVKFWNLWGSAIDAYDLRNSVISGNIFSQNNRSDTGAPDINFASCQANVVSLNTFSAPDSRTVKGKIYVEDASSTDNVIDLNTMEYNGGTHYYSTPVATVQPSSTLGSRNRPDAAWPFTTLKTITSNYSITKEDLFNEQQLVGNTTLTMTLPSVTSVHTGNRAQIKNVATGTAVVTVNTTSSQTIEGGTGTLALAAGQSVVLTSDGTGWLLTGPRSLAPAVIVPPLSLLTPPSAAAWATANMAILMRFTVADARTYRYVNLIIDTASGNFQAAVVRLSGSGLTAYTRVMDTGVITMPAAGSKHLDLGATLLLPGEYALAIWCDNTTATLRGASNGAVVATRLAAEITGATSGVPSSGTLAWSSSRFVYGATLEADV